MKQNKKIVVIAFTFFWIACGFTALADETLFFCSYVIDGDTIMVNYKTKVRLIGVDTPEMGEPLYKEAKDYMIKMADKKKVRLEYDKHKMDKYNRTLAYVYLMDGTFLNEELIKKGYGDVFNKEDFKYKKRFLDLQKKRNAPSNVKDKASSLTSP